ncbi:hypothetical protein [Methylacidimicrobium cyclopophantes]|nr:hypothetical protein [Methylacidimicrobium cyclopophantes]
MNRPSESCRGLRGARIVVTHRWLARSMALLFLRPEARRPTPIGL